MPVLEVTVRLRPGKVYADKQGWERGIIIRRRENPMELKILCEFEHEGQTYEKGIVLDNLERLTEEEIDALWQAVKEV